MEFIVLPISIISGLLIGIVFGFALTGRYYSREGQTIFVQNPVMRLFLTAARDRSFSQNLIYIVINVVWFFLFIFLAVLPFYISIKLGPLSNWLNVAMLLLFVIFIALGRLIGREIWLKNQ